jgi:hypothetical protein
MPDAEIANADAALPTRDGPMSAAEKILNTLREMSQPDPGASEMELMLSTVAMGLESSLGSELAEHQASGSLDEFVLALTRFLATHRSDDARALVVVELPRGRELPPGTRLHLLDEAIAAGEKAKAPF